MSIPQAIIHEKIPNHPGPGQYNTQKAEKLFTKNPSYSIAKSKDRAQSNISTPGPGYYKVKEVEQQLKKSISYTFKKSKIKMKIDSQNQNQVLYNPNYMLGKVKAPAYSIFKNKYNSQRQTERTPGPGQYLKEVKSTLKKGSAIFSTESKKYEKDTIPGPGQYKSEEVIDKLTKKRQSAIIPRAKFSPQKQLLPGPGQYQTLVSSISRNGGTIAKQINKQIKQITPGPGDYVSQSLTLKRRHPRFAITKEERVATTSEQQPGPGKYDISASYERILVKGPKAIIPKSQLNNKVQFDRPGPGSYLQSETSLSKKGGIIERSQKSRLSSMDVSNPGPGQYRTSKYANFFQSKKGHTIGKSRSKNPEIQPTPGPGQYLNQMLTSSLPQMKLKNNKLKLQRQIRNTSQQNNTDER